MVVVLGAIVVDVVGVVAVVVVCFALFVCYSEEVAASSTAPLLMTQLCAL